MRFRPLLLRAAILAGSLIAIGGIAGPGFAQDSGGTPATPAPAARCASRSARGGTGGGPGSRRGRSPITSRRTARSTGRSITDSAATTASATSAMAPDEEERQASPRPWSTSLKTLSFDQFLDTVVNGKQDVGTANDKEDHRHASASGQNVMYCINDIYAYLKTSRPLRRRRWARPAGQSSRRSPRTMPTRKTPAWERPARAPGADRDPSAHRGARPASLAAPSLSTATLPGAGRPAASGQSTRSALRVCSGRQRAHNDKGEGFSAQDRRAAGRQAGRAAALHLVPELDRLPAHDAAGAALRLGDGHRRRGGAGAEHQPLLPLRLCPGDAAGG